LAKAPFYSKLSVGWVLIEENEIKIGDKILISNYWRTGINYRGNVSEWSIGKAVAGDICTFKLPLEPFIRSIV
jgi:hypothetical protein